MRRHLYIITNRGNAQKGQTLSVDYDEKNYLSFFQSPEGGAWDDDEICIYPDNFCFEYFAQHIRMLKNAGIAYDYMVLVFCGHGCIDKNGDKWIEIRPDGTYGSDISLTQIRTICDGIRTLFISDACLKLYTGALRKTLLFSQLNEDVLNNADYRQRSQDLYNHYVSQTPNGIFVAAFAASPGESAEDTGRGGLYSLALLEAAKKCISSRTETVKTYGDMVDFCTIHNVASVVVAEQSIDKQHPHVLGSGVRSKAQLPFVVLPNLEYKPHLYL